MEGIFQPLYGERPKKNPEPIKEAPKVESTPPAANATQAPAINIAVTANKLKTAKNQLEGFVSDNKTLILIGVILIILIVLALIIYNQSKQSASIALVKKRLKKLK